MLIGNGRTSVDLVLPYDLGLLVVDPRLERAVDRLHEVLAVVPDMEAQQVIAEHAVEQLLLPGEDAKDLAIRPGDVPELGHDQVRIALLEVSGQQGEVVILDEDERRPIAGLLQDGVAEQGVDLAVHLPVLGMEDRAG